MSKPSADFKARVEYVLSRVYRGLHNAPEVHYGPLILGAHYARVSHYGDLSTYDNDSLTRLVIAAHDQALRASVRQGGPRMVSIWLHQRTREGPIMDGHPTIEAAIEKMSGRRIWTNPEVQP